MPGRLNIQKKITYSYLVLLMLISATAIIAYMLVQQIEKKMYFVEVIDNFLNLTLELRRYEKNYFLYHLDQDYQDNLSYLSRLDTVLIENPDLFSHFNPIVETEHVEAILARYREKMERFHLSNQKRLKNTGRLERLELQTETRESGKRLTLFAEQTAAREKEAIQKLLITSRTFLLSSIGAAVLFSLLLIMLLRKKIVISLRMLEEYTRKVAHGEMVDPPDKNVEDEIQTLFQAFTRMTNELRLRQRQMVQSEKLASLGTLLAGVAHELNNPLSNISTSAQILGEEINNPDKQFQLTMVGQIEEQTDKARDIVKTLLEFSRTGEFKKQELSLRKVVSSAISLLRSEIPAEMEIELDIDEDLLLWMDKQRMQQVFLNLIKNAIDACEQKGKIWISARDFVSNGCLDIEILLSDNGPGIPPEDVKKIFDPFYTSKDVGKGSGLGLFIVHDIIESHGGTISVDSRLGEGTTFIIWLPGGAPTT